MIKITRWDEWQTFRKDRGTPPWIKLYRNLLSNEEWVSLSDSEKGQLVSMWILAADKNGEIPENTKMIQRMAMLDSQPNINKFIELGFMTSDRQPVDNQVVTIPPQLDAPEESRVEESRVETESNFNQSEIDREGIEDGFEVFWKSGIRKVNKKKTKPLFVKFVKSNKEKSLLECVQFLCNDVKQRLYSNQLGFAEMHPTTYFNGERWNDEIKEAKNESNGQRKIETTSDRYQRQSAELQAREREARVNGQNSTPILNHGSAVRGQMVKREW